MLTDTRSRCVELLRNGHARSLLVGISQAEREMQMRALSWSDFSPPLGQYANCNIYEISDL